VIRTYIVWVAKKTASRGLTVLIGRRKGKDNIKISPPSPLASWVTVQNHPFISFYPYICYLLLRGSTIL